ncbi:LexA family transcriptional regulator [Parasphaerochaeta coccoides]|uniref:Phage repressor n=1 Tax=Parasphaerochaeta coccoides (strain ATCC BAA-1237 / DSM 17374 / SPN1) TaxID=760011 RepID=F4GHF3_PARC1|nr:S24 family peptidase [Parasphaerochaeta coccoides]AEC02052.1 putative phage repressor [Parasphaerochaeta coccoides DSM 17374]
MVGDRLKQARNEMRLSQMQLAKELGLAQSTYAKYELGGAIPEPVMQFLAQRQFNLHWLITGQGSMYLDGSGTDTLEPIAASTFITPKGKTYAVTIAEGVVSVPILTQRVSAGPGQEFLPADITEERLPVLERFVRMYPKESLFAAEVRGDSMTGIQLFDADLVIFVREQVEGDGIYVLSVDGEVFVKRVEFDPFDKKLTIRSENERYAPREVEADRVELLGKVVGWLHHHPY